MEVHADATRVSTTEVASRLQTLLGTKVTALIAGRADPKAIGEWARGERNPQPEAEQRLRNAYQIAALLLRYESPETVRAWFMGMNPMLDDRAPALVIGEDPTSVLKAARAFVATS
jgi:hypothetical protein